MVYVTGKHCSSLVNSAKMLFQPMNIIPKNSKVVGREEIPKSYKLMIDMGIIRQSSNGVYSILPLGLRALNKLQSLIDESMLKLGAQKLQLPALTEGRLWKESGRWNIEGLELIKVKDRHNRDYLLGPTHEESMAELVASANLSYNQCPLLLFQTTLKFRDEIKPRCGLLRAKEFLMKDLYSFDTSLSEANKTYDKVCEMYDEILKKLSLPHFKIVGSNEEMGGELSHEYHIPVDIGEDILQVCDNCNKASNYQLAQHEACSFCGHDALKKVKGVEVGHTFLLGTKYTETFKAYYKDNDNKKKPLVMGSYGLGLTRILMAAVEYLSLPGHIRWPSGFPPFSIVIITPKDGSKEASVSSELGLEIYRSLSTLPHLTNDILLDDRNHLTVGRRILFAKQTGYPFIIIIGSKSTSETPVIELQTLADGETFYLTVPELLGSFSKYPYEGSFAKV